MFEGENLPRPILRYWGWKESEFTEPGTSLSAYCVQEQFICFLKGGGKKGADPTFTASFLVCFLRHQASLKSYLRPTICPTYSMCCGKSDTELLGVANQ